LTRLLAVAARDPEQALGFIKFATADAEHQINSRST
jgi:hypothetical protein